MKKTILFIITLFIGTNISGQIHWMMCQAEGQNKNSLVDIFASKVVIDAPHSSMINYNRTLDQSSIPKIELALDPLDQCHIFTVFKPDHNAQEQLIWQIQNKNEDMLLLTNARVADLSEGRFINYLESESLEAQINTYSHFKNAFDSDKFILGGKPRNDQIPVSKFTGQLAEIIIFEQKLSPIAQQIIESHLALKYSIPIPAGMDYLDDQGQAIWRADRRGDYLTEVGGIGRNDLLHFHQKQSQSRLGRGHISFGLGKIERSNSDNPRAFNQGEYLTWSSNGEILVFDSVYAGIEKLRRSWMMTPVRLESQSHIAMEICHPKISAAISEHQHYWWLASEKPSIITDIKSIEAYLLRNETNTLSADSLQISHLSYGFLLRAPELWMLIQKTQPHCSLNQTGEISFRPIGGKAPYHITLCDQSGNEKSVQVLDNTPLHTFKNLKADIYSLSISDANGSTWQTSIYLDSEDMKTIDLPKEIIIEEGRPIILNASSEIEIPYDYSWTKPNGSKIESSEIELNQPGRYILSVEKEDCKTWHWLNVYQSTDNIVSSSVYPNPSIDGYFTFLAELKTPSPYTLTIVNASGQVVSSKSFPAAKHIAHRDRLEADGVHFITLKSLDSSITERLIIHGHN